MAHIESTLEKVSFYSRGFTDFSRELGDGGWSSQAPRSLFNWHYKKGIQAPFWGRVCRSTLKFIQSRYSFELPEILEVHESQDQTVKFLMGMKHGLSVETVLIPFHGKYTVCISSQVGCAMACSFCFTGTQGLKRSLETDEMVGQVLMARNWLWENRGLDEKLLNVVFMGQGEPLHNFEAVRDACRILISQYGLSFARHRVTVSTAGYLPGLLRWQEEMPDVNLALSLHSAFDDVRSELIPLNSKYPLKELFEVLNRIPLGRKRFITIEYLLIDGLNDGERDFKGLERLLNRKRSLINVIPFNPWPGSRYLRPSHEKVEAFRQGLVDRGFIAMARKTKGDEILAACGQLNSG